MVKCVCHLIPRAQLQLVAPCACHDTTIWDLSNVSLSCAKLRLTAPHALQTDTEAAVPSDLFDPHAYVPLPKSECTFRMVDGVIRVFHTPPPAEPLSPDFGTHVGDPQHDSPSHVNGDSSRSLPAAFAALPEAPPEEREAFPLPGTDREFFTDMLHLSRLSAAGPMMTYCHHRLTLLEQKFNLHVMLNAEKERIAQKTAPHRDLYNVRKVRASPPLRL